MKVSGEYGVLVGFLAKEFRLQIASYIPFCLFIILLLAFIISFFCKIFSNKINFLNSNWIKSLFYVNSFWLIVRALASFLASCLFFDIGPSFIRSAQTGGCYLLNYCPIFSLYFYLLVYFYLYY